MYNNVNVLNTTEPKMVKVVNFVMCIFLELELKRKERKSRAWSQTCLGLPPPPIYRWANLEQVT